MLVAKENMPKVWPGVKSFVAKAIPFNAGEYSIDHVVHELAAGRFQLWIGFDESQTPLELKLIAVTSISTYPERKRLRFEFIAGKDFEKFFENLNEIEQWARQYGATETEAYVRPGVAKLLQKLGFSRPYEMVLRPIGA
jgi:hypothetical protein